MEFGALALYGLGLCNRCYRVAEVASRALRVIHETDPREEIHTALGDLPSKVRVGGEDVLICRYVRTGRVATREGLAGLWIPDQTKDNDRWLQNTGLIIKMGPLAYKTEKTKRWFVDDKDDAHPPVVGDWVMFNPNTAMPFFLGERICFLVPAQHIFLVVEEPDIIQ